MYSENIKHSHSGGRRQPEGKAEVMRMCHNNREREVVAT